MAKTRLSSIAACAIALCCLSLRGAASSSPPELELSREGHVFRLQASFRAAAPPSAAWEVLTDYDGMTRFVSSLRESRVVRREGSSLVLEQEGVVRAAIFRRRIPITLNVVEKAPRRIDFSAIDSGQFEEYEGAWTVSESSGACLVSYQLFAEMKPSLVPRSMARRILEKSIRAQLEQVQAEIERRAAGKP